VLEVQQSEGILSDVIHEQDRRFRRWVSLAVVGGAIASAGVVALASSSSAASEVVRQPPPEWAANANAWPAHNYDLANTRPTERRGYDRPIHLHRNQPA
jgi:hypothetical protein